MVEEKKPPAKVKKEASASDLGTAGKSQAKPAAKTGGTAVKKEAAVVESPLWTACKATPWDFDCWNALVPNLEKIGKPNEVREAYECLLKEFPLCFGYWEKYARLEAREVGKEAQITVYNRGVAAVPCVELWSFYCATMVNWISREGEDNLESSTAIARRTFQQAIASVGTHWTAGPLWDAYVKFEEERAEGGILSQAVASLLLSGSAMRTAFAEQLAAKLDSVIDGAGEELLEAIMAMLSEETKAAVLAAVAEGNQASAAATAVAAAAAAGTKASEAVKDSGGEGAGNESGPAAEKQADGGDDDGEEKGANEKKATEEEKEPGEEAESETAAAAAAAAAAEKEGGGGDAMVTEGGDKDPLAGRKVVLKKVLADLHSSCREWARRKAPYEERIKRTYFHYKPLDQTQRDNWAAYLHAMSQLGNDVETREVGERALLPCWSLPEVWVQLAGWREALGDLDGARAYLERGVVGPFKRRPDLKIQAGGPHETEALP